MALEGDPAPHPRTHQPARFEASPRAGARPTKFVLHPRQLALGSSEPERRLLVPEAETAQREVGLLDDRAVGIRHEPSSLRAASTAASRTYWDIGMPRAFAARSINPRSSSPSLIA
jgi:hypothetical protein